MKLESLIQKGIAKKPPRIVLHGIQKVGKSTFAAQAPNPVFLITEDGLTEIDVPHFQLATTLQEVWDYMAAIIKEDHEYKTFVVDTLDWLEKLIWNQVCADHNIKSPEDLGYGKAYVFAMTYWEKFLNGIDKIRDKGLAIILLAHNEIKTHNPPDGSPFDRYQIKLHRHAAAKIEEWADAILFANFKIYIQEKQKKATGSGERLIYTTPNPAWRAGNSAWP